MKLERLGEKIIQVRGISYKPNDISATPIPDYVPILKANNIQEEGIDTSDLIYIHKSKVKPEQFIKKGDLLLAASSGSKEIVGKNIYFESDFEGSFGAFCKLVRPKNNINSRFLATFFKSVPYKRHIRKLLNGALINNLKNEYIDSLLIPDISNSNQLHIANILSKAQNLIAQRKESIRLLDEFLKGTFLEMFGDIKGKKNPLTTACIFNPKKSEIAATNKTIEVSFIPMASVSEQGEVDLSQTKILESVWTGFTYFRENDVVFAKITPCMENGKGAIMKKLKNDIGFGTTEFHVLRPIEGVSTAAWLYHLTKQQSFRKKAEQNMTGSAGQKRVPSIFFEKYKVVIPHISLQTQFAHIVEKTEALKSQYQQSLQELENLYGSLSQKAFSGELKLAEDEERVLMAAEPEPEYKAQSRLSISSNKKGFAKLVLAGKIIVECKDSPEFTNIKFQKLQYLSEHLMEADLNLNYYNQAAGPYDNRFMHTLHNKMRQQKWFSSRGYKYIPMEKSKDISGYFDRYFGADNQQFSQLINLLGNATEDQCEIMATLYAVWNDRIIRKEIITNDAIIKDFFNWSDRKQKYSSGQLIRAIEWIKQNGLEPKGFGELIKHSKKKNAK